MLQVVCVLVCDVPRRTTPEASVLLLAVGCLEMTQ